MPLLPQLLDANVIKDITTPLQHYANAAKLDVLNARQVQIVPSHATHLANIVMASLTMIVQVVKLSFSDPFVQCRVQ